MLSNLPVTHAPSLAEATGIYVLGFSDLNRGFVAACRNDGANTTSFPLPWFFHHCCTALCPYLSPCSSINWKGYPGS